MKYRKLLSAALCTTLYCLPALAIEIESPWARATPPGSTLSAAFLTVNNSAGEADRLLLASTPAAGRVEIHETRMDGDVMQMRQLEQGLGIAAGAAVELAPGGLHLMLLDLGAPLVAGESLPLTLQFEKAGEIVVEVTVRAPGEQDAASGHDHHHHH
jgi:copper(I)-binding protein